MPYLCTIKLTKKINAMLRKIFLLGAVLFTCQVQAQTTAMDWTKTDCNSGTEHHLFDDLDNGFVIVQEYVMMNCTPCITGGNGLKTLVAPYNTTHPGKIKLYQTSYNNTTSCTTMNNWASTNNFTGSSVFTMGSTEVNYYGGMGMPTIVIMGGASHRVFYTKQGYSPSDNANITAAINDAIAESALGTKAVQQVNQVQISPNPAVKNLLIQSEKPLVQSEIVSLSGQIISSETLYNLTTYQQNIETLPTGMYFVRLRAADGTVSLQKFVKQ